MLVGLVFDLGRIVSKSKSRRNPSPKRRDELERSRVADDRVGRDGPAAATVSERMASTRACSVDCTRQAALKAHVLAALLIQSLYCDAVMSLRDMSGS